MDHSIIHFTLFPINGNKIRDLKISNLFSLRKILWKFIYTNNNNNNNQWLRLIPNTDTEMKYEFSSHYSYTHKIYIHSPPAYSSLQAIRTSLCIWIHLFSYLACIFELLESVYGREISTFMYVYSIESSRRVYEFFLGTGFKMANNVENIIYINISIKGTKLKPSVVLTIYILKYLNKFSYLNHLGV